MKKILWLLFVLPIIATIIALFCGVPVLNWVAWLFNLIAKLFSGVGWCCGWLQDLINTFTG